MNTPTVNNIASNNVECEHGEPKGPRYCGLCRANGYVFAPVVDARAGRTRRDDHATSIAGANSVAYRAGSQKERLLRAYRYAGADGLTDEEACVLAGISLRSCYWKRCSELREDGVIASLGRSRPGDAGVPRIVCAITSDGEQVWRVAQGFGLEGVKR